MKPNATRIFLASMALLLPGLGFGQVVPEFAPWVTDRPTQTPEYNIKVGSVYFDVVGRFEVEWTDNVSSTEVDEQDDIYVAPGINLSSTWQITDLNKLSLNIGASYREYFNNDEFDSSNTFLDIDPETELSFTVFVGDVEIRFFDQITFSSDPTDVVVPNDDPDAPNEFRPETYERFDNMFGAQATFDLNRVIIQMEASRADIWALDDQFDFEERTTYKLASTATYDYAANLRVGFGASWGTIDYNADFHNDADNFSFGPFAVWNPTELITVTGGVSWYQGEFESGGEIMDDTDVDSFTATASVAHLVNESFSHRLAYERRINLGFISNVTTIDALNYTFKYDLNEALVLRGLLTGETGEDSGGVAPEDYDRIAFGLGTEYQLRENLSATLDYVFVTKDSDRRFSSYDKNTVTVLFRYDF